MNEEEPEQKEKEDIMEVAEAGSETSEDTHGGNEATRDIKDSPNSANEGKKEEKTIRSAREKIGQGSFEHLRHDTVLSYEQFGRALSKLVTLISESAEYKTKRIDAKATARSIARHAGSPEFVWTDELENKPKVVILFDVGGSTDKFRPIIENLFSAAKDYLDDIEVYYFHNAIYGQVWPQSDGNYGIRFIPLSELLKKDSDTKFVIVGDAQMGGNDLENGGLHDSYTDLKPGEARIGNYYRYTGLENFAEIVNIFPSTVWLNPILKKTWGKKGVDTSETIADTSKVVPMFDLSLVGIEAAVKKLTEDN